MSGWNDIDSDAGVFTELVEKLQVSNVELNDIYSIDSESFRALDPVYGVIFLFKYSNTSGPLHGEYDPDYQQKGMFFARQTIQNACATQAVLNVLLNVPSIDVGSELGNLKAFSVGFDATMAGETIGNSELIRTTHNSFSPQSSIEIPSAPGDKDSDLFHFVGYLPFDGHIYELDGLKPYPVKHVACKPEEFCDKLPGVLQERISSFPASELRFSTLVISNNKLEESLTRGDDFEAARQMEKREGWKRENEMRKHDYNPLIFALLRNMQKK